MLLLVRALHTKRKGKDKTKKRHAKPSQTESDMPSSSGHSGNGIGEAKLKEQP